MSLGPPSCGIRIEVGVVMPNYSVFSRQDQAPQRYPPSPLLCRRDTVAQHKDRLPVVSALEIRDLFRFNNHVHDALESNQKPDY